MRRGVATLILIGTTGAIGLFGAESPAAPPSPQPAPTPTPTAKPQVSVRAPFIASVKRAGPTAIADGPVSFEIEIVNTLTQPLQASIKGRLMRVGDSSPSREAGTPAQEVSSQTGGSAPSGAGSLSADVQIAAGARGTVTVTDAGGLPHACEPAYYAIGLVTAATPRPPLSFIGVTPSCMFGVKTADPNEDLAPDRRASLKAGKVSYDDPSLPQRKVVCGGMLIQATAKNRSSSPATGVRLKLAGPNGIEAFTSAFDMPPNASRAHDLGNTNVTSGKWTLQIEGNGAPLHQPGWNVTVSKLCSVQVALLTALPGPAPRPTQRGE